PALDPLLKAVKVALARHHQVMVIVPWPPDLDPPGRDEEPALARSSRKQVTVKEKLKQLTPKGYARPFHPPRRTLPRLQVPVICAADKESIPLILDRIDRLRGVRRRR